MDINMKRCIIGMKTAIALVGIGSALVFVILVIVGIVGVILRKSWGRKTLVKSLIPLLLFFMCIVMYGG